MNIDSKPPGFITGTLAGDGYGSGLNQSRILATLGLAQIMCAEFVLPNSGFESSDTRAEDRRIGVRVKGVVTVLGDQKHRIIVHIDVVASGSKGLAVVAAHTDQGY